MKKIICLLSLAILLSFTTLSQVSINSDESPPDESAILDVSSTERGLLVPRMSLAQMEAIADPANGLIVFCLDDEKFYCYTEGVNGWRAIAFGESAVYLPATYSLGSGGTCYNTVIHGDFIKTIPVTANEYVTVDVAVTTPGAYSIWSDTVNGYSFSGTGHFEGSGTGIKTVQLMASGTPLLGQTDQFTLSTDIGTGSCTFSITVDPCGGQITDPRDSQTYDIKKIGTQCWFTENINVGTMINASTGGTNGDGQQTDNGTVEKWCYGENSNNCDIYGGLYQWEEMMQYVSTEGTQGICPNGWHIPTFSEWTDLITYLGGTSVAGGAMKDTTTTLWQSPNQGATNSSGFTGLPGGLNWIGFQYQGERGFFWSSTIYDTDKGRLVFLMYSSATAITDMYYWYFGLSVRCLKD